MHGCSSASVLIVNAEVVSMRGVGFANKTSPRKAAIEKVQAELRQEYDVREERKRELEFLVEGGNPLDYKLGNAASLSVQSTSFTVQHPDQLVTSEAKGCYAFTASPHGDSVESSGRPGLPSCEPNSADNLMLFDAENESSEGDRNLFHPSRDGVVPSEQSGQMGRSHKFLEHGDSAPFDIPRKAYRRRFRSRPSRDGAWSSSGDVNPTHGNDGSSLPSRCGPRDVKGLLSDAEKRNTSLNWNSRPTSPIDSKVNNKTMPAHVKHDMELDGLKSMESTKNLVQGDSTDAVSDAIASKNSMDEQPHQQSLSDQAKAPNQMESNGHEGIQAIVEITSSVIECQASPTANKTDIQFSSYLTNGFSEESEHEVANDAHNSCALRVKRDLDSESCKQTNLNIDRNNDNETSTSNGNVKDQSLISEVVPVLENDKIKETKDTEGINSSIRVNEESASPCRSNRNNGFALQEEEFNQSVTALENEVKDQLNFEGMEACGPTGSEPERRKKDPSFVSQGLYNETSSNVRQQDSLDIPISDLPEAGSLTRVSNVSREVQTSSRPNLKLPEKIDEDSILREAEIIKAKRRRIANLSIAACPTEIRRKSHWDYVLEEMAWLANDFAQERIWKLAAAAQVSYRAASACHQEKCSGVNAKKVALTLAKAVLEFWHCVEEQIEETKKELEQHCQKDGVLSVRTYAVRFLKSNKPNILQNQVEVPLTPDRISDSRVLDVSWEDTLTEENLFYAVPDGAMETYRKSIGSHVVRYERIRNIAHEEVETSACDTEADFESQDIAYDEDQGEGSAYNTAMTVESSKSLKFGQKKQKNLTHDHGSQSYQTGPGLLPLRYVENKDVTEQSALLAKRPGSSLKVSIPTKRVRTASRRVVSPFGAGASECNQVPNKTDASSGDTNSFQDDQSTLQGGLLVPINLEVDSVGDLEKQALFDSAEVTKPKKKKKAKHLNAAYEHRWQVDSSYPSDQIQREHLKRRSESYQLEAHGNSGFGQSMTKKPKIIRQSQDNSFDNIPPSGGSVPSPGASQMSNMSNPNKCIRMLGGRDQGRKAKALKMPSGQLGSGSPWSLFEDQALVVLVHDLGPNWELVSDAINSTLHFKCIFRKAKECKEHHNILMDRTSGDGADSAEDSGSSQPYPSTLPGIPKGSARQLFQRLQGRMEEDKLKSHFEKIIMIGQKQLYRKNQNKQDPEPIQPHTSHAVALSQVFPNNLNGGRILTPWDLRHLESSSSEVPLGFEGPFSSGLGIANQNSAAPMLPAAAASSMLQGSQNKMIGNNFSSSPSPLSSSFSRDGRYMVPQSAPLSADEQQRLQHLVPGRNLPQTNISAAGALPGTDSGGCVVRTGNGMGMIGGVSRSLPMARTGFQGIASSSMTNSGSMVSHGMPSANIHSVVCAAQGSSMLRPREALHMMREFQMPGNSQGVSHFGGYNSPSASSYPMHHQPSHPSSPQPPQALIPHTAHFQGPAHLAPPSTKPQACAMRLAKDRQLQHRILQQQQQQQFPASSSLMPHVQQSQPQLPISSPVENSPQIPNHTTLSPPRNSIAQHQHQQKQQTPTQGVIKNAHAGGSGLANQTGKQRPKQQQLANRQHPPQQRQQLQAQQQIVAKAVGRGNMTMNQNIPVDSSLPNGVSTNSENHCPGIAPHLLQNPGLYSAVQPRRQYVASQQKMSSVQAPSSSKHMQSGDNSSQGLGPPAGNQSVQSSAVTGLGQQQAPPHQKLVNQNQPVLHRAVQPNCLMSSNPSTKPQGRDSDANEHPTSNSAENDTAYVAQVVPPAVVHQRTASEPLLDSDALNSAMPNSNDSVPKAGQGAGQRPLSAGLPPSRHDNSAQWQQKQHQQVQVSAAGTASPSRE